ncbi:MAG: hypothetical protein J2O48_09405, partial [Solirubrobacterales bacterium]|nr:hypothetical protein [Solirubrobacterales bacterium]
MFTALRHRRRTAVLVVALVAMLLPAGYAAATSLSAGADHHALGAYRTYLNSLIASEGSAQSAERSMVSGVRDGCGGALSNLRHAHSNSRVRAAMTNFGHEIDADLTLTAVRQRGGAVNRLAGTLAGLHWSSSKQRAVTTNLISAQRGLLRVGSSNLCLD